MPVRRIPGAAGSAAGRREAPRGRIRPPAPLRAAPEARLSSRTSRAWPGHGAPSPSRQGSEAEGSCGAVLTTGRELQTLPSSDRRLRPETRLTRARRCCTAACVWGVRSEANARPSAGRRASANERPGAHGACARGAMRDARHRILQPTDQRCAGRGRQVRMGRAVGPGARCGRQCSRGRPRGVAGCAWGVRSGRTPVTRQRIPESTDHECVGWSTAGCGWARSLRGGRPLRGGCPAPRPERRVPVVERAGAHGACAQGQMPVVWQWILRSTKARRRCQAARCAWGVRSAPVPGAGGSAHEAVHEGLPGAHGACAQAGCPLRGNEFPGRPHGACAQAGYAAVVPARPRQGAHAACARRRLFVAWRLSRASTEEACAGGGARRCAWGVRSGRIPVTRQRIPRSTEGRASGEERPGDHGASGRVGTPGAGGAHEGVSGSCRVIMGRALRAARPSRGNGFSHRSEGGRGRARQRGRPGGAGGRHGVRGDHGACAQGRIPVRGNGSLESTCAVRQRRTAGDHGVCGRSENVRDRQMRPRRQTEGSR